MEVSVDMIMSQNTNCNVYCNQKLRNDADIWIRISYVERTGSRMANLIFIKHHVLISFWHLKDGWLMWSLNYSKQVELQSYRPKPWECLESLCWKRNRWRDLDILNDCFLCVNHTTCDDVMAWKLCPNYCPSLRKKTPFANPLWGYPSQMISNVVF